MGVIMPGKEIVAPRIVVRPLLPPPPQFGARLQPQHLHWQVGRYRERLTSGPGGLGRGKVWVVEREAEQHNLILNQTYDSLMAQYGFLVGIWAAVGTGSTPPDVTQTSLVNQVARTNADNTGATNRYALTRVSDGVVDISVIREFTETQVGGRNLTEWGFAPTQTPANNLMSRELFRDGSGNPVVLTLDTDQRLRLIYKWRVTVNPAVPQSVSINIAGIGARTGVLYLRRSVPTSEAPWNLFGSDYGDIALLHSLMADTATAPTMAISPVNATPSYGTTEEFAINTTPFYNKNTTRQAYVSGSRQRRTAPVTWNSNEANDTIRFIGFYALRITTGQPARAAPMGLKLNAGQEFTKSDLYKLRIDEWTVTWGP